MPGIPPILPPEDFELGVFVRSFLTGLPEVKPPDTFEDAVHRAVCRRSFTLRNWIIVLVGMGLIGGLIYWVSFHNVSVVHTPVETVPNFYVVRPSLKLMDPVSNLSLLDSPVVITPTFKAIQLPMLRESIIATHIPKGKRRVSNRLGGVAGY